ncbi:MAG: FadR family transcriptional regulator [Rhizobiales bacterium]|nr:FadR family transcriptional regulator [Hyphomicrobiales bacterium]
MSKQERNYLAVASQIEDLIRSKYEDGDRIPGERDLAKRFESSRPTIREAIVSLEIAGLVEVRRNSGIYVNDKSRAPKPDAGYPPFEILDARMIVEPEVARLAARQAGADDFEKMAIGIEQMVKEDAQDRPTEQGDRAFHLAIAGACGNAMLRHIVELLWDQQQRSELWLRADAYGRTKPFRHVWIEDHSAVMEAIRRQDPDLARRAMRCHLANTRRCLLEAGQA